MNKFCKYCQRDLPDTEYYLRPGTKILRYQCKACTNKRNVAQNRKNRLRINARNRLNRHKDLEKVRNIRRFKMFGISSDLFILMNQIQDYRCAICNKEEIAVSYGRKQHLKIDHCHKTGKIRNLLCRACNVGLGVFKEDTEALQAAINYILAYKD